MKLYSELLQLSRGNLLQLRYLIRRENGREIGRHREAGKSRDRDTERKDGERREEGWGTDGRDH